jgi:toxin ParE1/3/4
VNYAVSFAPTATADLEDVFDYIAGNSGEQIARNYVAEIYRYCLGLDTFPHRGTGRDDLLPGLRLVGFKHQATIAFLIEDTNVFIIRVFYGGRDIRFSDE